MDPYRIGVRREAVVVEPVGEAVVAVRDSLDGQARQPLGIVHQRSDARFHGIDPLLFVHGGQALLAPPAGSHLGVQVAAHVFGRAAVGGQHVDDVVLKLPRRRQPDQRDAQAFRQVIECARRRAAGRRAADVLVVHHGGDVTHQATRTPDRRCDADVGQVSAPGIGVVDDIDIPRRGAGRRIAGRDGTAELAEHAEVHRNGAGLGDRAALAVEHRAGGVQGFGDDRRVGAAQQHEFHLVGNRGEPPAQHLEGDRVKGGTVARGTARAVRAGGARIEPLRGGTGAGFPVSVHAGIVAASG